MAENQLIYLRESLMIFLPQIAVIIMTTLHATAQSVHIKTFNYWVRLPIKEEVEKEARKKWKFNESASHSTIFVCFFLMMLAYGINTWSCFITLFNLFFIRMIVMTVMLGVGTTSKVDRLLSKLQLSEMNLRTIMILIYSILTFTAHLIQTNQK